MRTRAVPVKAATDIRDDSSALRGRDWLFALALVASVVLAYQPAWHAGFIWDDDVYVTNNPLLTAPDGLRRIWFSLDSPSQYFPLAYTALYFEHALWGLNPAGYHWVNILLHAANALLVWRLLARLRVPGSWLAAAIFALHPVQVESVAWVTEIKNLLMTFFFLLALLSWAKFVDEKTTKPWRFYALTLICYALALAAKTTACTMPVALLLILWLEKTPIDRKRIAQMAPFVALGIGMGLVTMWWERFHQFTQGKMFAIGLVERVLIASRAVWFYAGKLFWPAHLAFSYPRWNISISDPKAWLWLLATAVIGVVIWRARRWTGRSVEVAAVFFAATLGPVLGFIMLYTFRYSFVADHYQYLACLGPIALASAGAKLAFDRFAARIRFLPPALGAALLLALGALTWRQCGNYADPETLWRATLAQFPNSWIAHDNLAGALDDKREIEPAIAQYQMGLALNPTNMMARKNLGIDLARVGKVDEAIAQYRMAVEIEPSFVEARNALGVALVQKGELDEAIAQYQKILDIRPDFSIARKNLGNALLRKGDFAGAMACYEKVLPLNGNPLERWYGLGNDFLHYGELVEAIACYQQVVRIQPQFADGFANLGVAYFQKKDMKEAIAAWQTALVLNADLLSARNNLAWLLATSDDASLRDGAKAVTLAEKSNLLTGGDNPIMLHTLAAAYAEAGRFADAVAAARRAGDLAVKQTNKALAAKLQAEIALYEHGTPLHETNSR